MRECSRCPKFVVRCGHLGEAYRIDNVVTVEAHDGEYDVVGVVPQYVAFATRAEADAEFARREEALLA